MFLSVIIHGIKIRTDIIKLLVILLIAQTRFQVIMGSILHLIIVITVLIKSHITGSCKSRAVRILRNSLIRMLKKDSRNLILKSLLNVSSRLIFEKFRIIFNTPFSGSERALHVAVRLKLMSAVNIKEKRIIQKPFINNTADCFFYRHDSSALFNLRNKLCHF